MCIGFRILSKQTKFDAYSAPQIDNILDYLCKARVFLKTDLSNAYCEVAVELLQTHKTVFFTKYRLFKLLALLFRLVKAPAKF